MKYKFVRTFVKHTNLTEFGKHCGIDCLSPAANEAMQKRYAKERDVTMRVFYRFEPDEAHPGHIRIMCKIKCPINPIPVRGEFETPNMAVLKRFLLAAGWVEHDCMNLSDVE